MFCQPGFNFFNENLKHSEYNYLEIGVFNGDSIAELGKAYSDKTIYAVDPFIEDGCTEGHSLVRQNEFMSTQHANTLRNINGLENINLFTMTSVEFKQVVESDTDLKGLMNVGWVLIDGSHEYSDVVNDVELAMMLIGDRMGGIVFDDANLDGPKRAHDEFVLKYADKISEPIDLFADVHAGHILAYFINEKQ